MSSCAELTQQADVLIIAGTSGAVAPINMIPRQVYQNGGTLIECNLGTSAFEPFSSIRFAASAELVLPQIAAQVRRLKQGSDQV
jgi:NAD-dependent deacetylase